MHVALKAGVGIVALLFTGLGLTAMFMPGAATAQFALQPDGLVGLSSLRGDLGGFFLGSVALLVLGLVRGEGRWILSVAVLLGAVAFGRLGADPVDKALHVDSWERDEHECVHGKHQERCDSNAPRHFHPVCFGPDGQVFRLARNSTNNRAQARSACSC